jgi:hypothetical protein
VSAPAAEYEVVVDCLASAHEMIEELEEAPRPFEAKIANALAALREAQFRMYCSLSAFDSPSRDS